MEPIYLKFYDSENISDLIDELLYSEADTRWRVPRKLSRIQNPKDRQAVFAQIDKLLNTAQTDWILRYRLMLAKKLLKSKPLSDKYVIIRNKGAYTRTEFEAVGGNIQALDSPSTKSVPYPIIDFHVHPKLADGPFLSDLRNAGISHAVILATDTDPADTEREEIQQQILQKYAGSQLSMFMSFPEVLTQLQNSLYSPSHITNQDVADWVADYPDQLIGFGSVNLSKHKEYVVKTLNQIKNGPFRGIKLLPFSQFFDPSTNENMDLLMQTCQKYNLIVLSHTGCSAGIFEDPRLNANSHPKLWTTMAERYPDVPIVLAHFGAYSQMYPGIWFDEAIELMVRYDNVYADTAAVWGLLQNEAMVKKIRNRIGFDRVLFGSDYPMPTFMPDGSKGVISALLKNSLLSDEETYKIMGQNASQLLGLK